MKHSPGGVVASDGTSGRISPETITELGIKHGAFRRDERAAVLAKAKADPGGVLTTVCRVMTAVRAATPATPATPGSGASVAAGSGVPPVAYPSGWAGAVERVQRVAGRGRQPVAQPAATVPAAAGAGQVYPARMASEVSASRRASGVRVGAAKDRARSAVRAEQPIHDPADAPRLIAAQNAKAQAQVVAAQAGSTGYYDKSPKASAFAAAQEAARVADVQRMAAEQKARFGA